MPLVTLDSSYPGVAFAEVPYLTTGVSVEVTEEEKQKILAQFAGFQHSVQQNIRLSFSGDVETASTPAIAVVPVVPLTSTPAVEVFDANNLPPAVEDLTELSDEDLELVEIEVAKLHGKTVAEAEPFVIATGGNIELPRLLRVAYVDAIIASPEIAKSLKKTAEKLREQI